MCRVANVEQCCIIYHIRMYFDGGSSDWKTRGVVLFPALFYSKVELDVRRRNGFAAFLAILVPVFIQVDVFENGAGFRDDRDARAALFAAFIPPGDIYASAFESSDGNERAVVLFGYRCILLQHVFHLVHDNDRRLFHLPFKFHHEVRFASRIFQFVYILRVHRDRRAFVVPDRVFDAQLERK